MKSKFTVRTTKPTKANKEFVTESAGGWSGCIKGSPTDAGANVLSNCVGYASGRLNEAYNEMFGTTGCKYYWLNCNAENFIERAQAKYPNLKFSQDPVVGSIICWRRGSTGSSSDGAGHVEFVEKVYDNNTIMTSASNYGGTAFYTNTRKRGSGSGGWGLNSPYAFRAFIYDPAMQIKVPVPVDRDVWVDQVEVTEENLRVRVQPSLSADIKGICAKGFFNVKDTSVADGYKWYKIGDEDWIAGVEGTTVFHAKKDYEEPKPVDRDETVNQLQVDITGLRIRVEPNTTCKIMGSLEKGIYNVVEVEKKADYTWYKLGENAYAAGVEGVTYLPFTEDPTIKELKEKIKELEKKNAELAKINLELNALVADKDVEIQRITKDLEIARADVDERDKRIEGFKPIAEEANAAIDKLIAEL